MNLHRLLALVLVVLLSYPLPAQIAENCPGNLPPRLVVGQQGQVTPGSSNNMRLAPSASADRIGQIPGESVFRVVAGPTCADGLTWWQVDYNGLVGWTVESSGDAYWVEPLAEVVPPVPTITPTPEPPPAILCEGALSSRLMVGAGGRVVAGVSVNVRDQPSSGGARLGQMDGGGLFTVLAGPVCADGFAWWQAEGDHLTGWIVEGTAEAYWLEPLTLAHPDAEPRGVIAPTSANRVREIARLGRGTAEAVLWSPDGSTIAALGSLGVWLYDVDDLTREPRLFDAEGRWRPPPRDTHRPGLDRRVAFSVDGELLALGYCVQLNTDHSDTMRYHRARRDCAQGVLEVWEVASGQQISRYHNDGGGIISVSFARNHDVVAFGSEDNVLRLWNLNTNSVLSEIDYDGDILRVALDPDGSRAAVWAYNPDSGRTAVLVWEFSEPVGRLDEIPLGPDVGREASFILTGPVAFSPDLSHAAGSVEESQGIGLPVAHPVRVYDLTSPIGGGFNIRFSADEPAASSYGFSPDSRQLAIGTPGGTIRVWSLAEEQAALTIEQAHDRAVLSIAFSPDSSRLATVGRDQLVHIWDAASGDRLATITGYGTPLQAVRYSPDGASVVTLSQQEYLRADVVSLWNANDGVRRWQHDDDWSNSEWGGGMAFHPDGSRLIVAGRLEGGLLQFDVQTGEPSTLMVEDLPEDSVVYQVAYTPDGSRVVISHFGPGIRVWDTVTGQLVHYLTREDSEGLGVVALVVSPDGTLLAANSSVSLEQGRVSLWELTSGTFIRDLPTETGNVLTVAFSPDGRLIAAGGITGVVHLWEAATGREIAVWEVSSFDPETGRAYLGEGLITNLAFSPDGALLAIAVKYLARDDRPQHDLHDIRVWDVTNGEELAKLTGHTDEIRGLDFSPDGTRLASASLDGTVRLWGIAPFEDSAGNLCMTARPRLVVDELARQALAESSLRVRDAAGGRTTGNHVFPGQLVRVMSGPVCVENVMWWEIASEEGWTGWVAEAGQDNYLFEAVTRTPTPTVTFTPSATFTPSPPRTPTPTATPIVTDCIILPLADTNLRVEPDVNSAASGIAERGVRYYAQAMFQPRGEEFPWWQIGSREGAGTNDVDQNWIRADFVIEEGECDSLPMIQQPN
jgi:WD40 repeat protein